MCNITPPPPRSRVDTVEVERFEINPDHEIFVMLDKVRETDPELAQRAVAQVFDNALIAAGLLEDPRGMLGRLNMLITDALKVCQRGPGPARDAIGLCCWYGQRYQRALCPAGEDGVMSRQPLYCMPSRGTTDLTWQQLGWSRLDCCCISLWGLGGACQSSTQPMA
jgi:hypothetical protein